MVKRKALAMTLAVAAVSGLSAQSAFAGTVAVETNAAGVKRVLFGESRVPANDPVDPAKTVAADEQNTIKITLSGGAYTIQDSTTPISVRGSINGPCAQGADANHVVCSAAGVQQLNFPLGQNVDSFDNQTSTPAVINGGGKGDTIINSGGGDDVIDIAGDEKDTLRSCGAGNDTLTSDVRDDIGLPTGAYAAHQCEMVNGKSTVPVPGQPTPPPAQGGSNNGSNQSGNQAPASPVDKAPVAPSQVGTPAPVAAAVLQVAPTSVPGACKVPFIGTALADRIDGSSDGDIEYGQAGDDFMNGQVGDDCLYGMDGNDTLIGDDGLDLLVGGNGNDKAFGGAGNDKVFGNLGADTLNGNDGRDRISAGAGNDKLYGDAGDDLLLGSAGNDRLSGGLGNDTLSGGEGRDLLFGSAGKDSINAGKGTDRVDAGAGNDIINVRDGQKDVVNCGLGRDSVTADKKDVLRGCERVSRR
jgi:Ca2+-binding RTX toxin-like protein